jgi:hypothetical protein
MTALLQDPARRLTQDATRVLLFAPRGPIRNPNRLSMLRVPYECATLECKASRGANAPSALPPCQAMRCRTWTTSSRLLPIAVAHTDNCLGACAEALLHRGVSMFSTRVKSALFVDYENVANLVRQIKIAN